MTEEIGTLLLKNIILETKTWTQECTIFDMMGNGSKETLHSAMIGFLINPYAHDAGAFCLQEFLKLFPEDKISSFNPESGYKVVLEYDLGPIVIDGCPTGGRVDIYVEDASGYVLVIENKIYAGDQQCQLLRYHNTLESRKQPHKLIYLTLFGNPPSKYSLGIESVQSPLSVNEVMTISYRQVDQWLTSIKDECSPSIAYNIRQYQELISKLIMKETIIKTLLSSGDNYLSALKIAEYIEDCRMELKRMFIQDIKEALSGYASEEISNGKLVGISIKLETNMTIDILIDWRLYISCKNSDNKGVKLENGTWEYIGGYDDYNFHNGSPKVIQYLTTRNEGNPVIKDVATILKAKFHNIIDKQATF